MAIKFNATVRQAHATTLNTEAGNSAQLKIYTGSPPANVATAATGTLLGTLTGSAGGFGTVSGGVVTVSTVTGDSSADATGTAGWFRLLKSDGTTAVMDGTVSGTGGGGDLQLDSTSIVAGGTINLTTAGASTITMGGA